MASLISMALSNIFTLAACGTLPVEYAPYDCTALKEIRVNDLASWCEMEKGYFSLSQIERFYVNDELLEGELIIPEGVNRISSRSFPPPSSGR